MATSSEKNKIMKLSQAEYTTLSTTGTLTKDGVTYTYSPSDTIYVTPDNMSKQYAEYKTVPAYIINKDISNLSEIIVINVGSDDGVDANMPVITSEGLVGYTISVTNKTAKVKLIIDASGSTSAQISTSRESVVTQGILRKYTFFKANVYSNRSRFSNRRYNRNFWNGRNISKRHFNW